jgi:hypothetical protein
LDPDDPLIDITAHYAFVRLDGEFGSRVNPALDLELDVSVLEFTGADLFLDLSGGVELYAYVDGIVDVTAAGTIIVHYVESAAGEISLSSTSGDIFIDYLNAGFENGIVNLSAAGSVSEVAEYDLQVDLTASYASITAGRDVGNPQESGLALETELHTLDALAVNSGSIFLNELDSLELLSVLAQGGAVTITAGENIVVGGPATADAELSLHAGGSITITGDEPVTSQTLEAAAGYGIFLRTKVEMLTAGVTVQGTLQIDEADGIILESVTNAHGPIRIAAGGTITAIFVEAQNDGPGSNVSLLALTGDVLIDYVAVGITSGQMSISSAEGDIREVDDFDPDIDLLGSLGILYARGEIGSKSHPDLNLETALGRIIETRGGDLKLRIKGDVDLYFIVEGRIDVRTTGTINAIYVVSLTDDIRLKSHCGDINVEYLEAGSERGDVSLHARGSIYVGRIVAGDDVSIHAHREVQVNGDIEAGDDVYIRAGYLVSIHADINAGDDVDIRVCRGKLDVFGRIEAGDDVDLRSRHSIVVSGDVVSGDDIELKSCHGDVFVEGSLTAADDVRIRAGDTVSIYADITAGDDVDIWAKCTVSIYGDITAGDDIDIRAGKVVSIYGDVTAGDDVDIWAGYMVSVSGNITADDDIYLFGRCFVDITGTLEAGDRICIRSHRSCHKGCRKKH